MPLKSRQNPPGKGGSAVIAAFVSRQQAKLRADETDGWTLYFHGHPIAWHQGDGYRLTLAGYNTRTTRGRLNQVLERIGSRYRISKVGQHPFLTSTKEVAVLSPTDIIEIEGKKRPIIKGKHRGVWEKVS